MTGAAVRDAGRSCPPRRAPTSRPGAPASRGAAARRPAGRPDEDPTEPPCRPSRATRHRRRCGHQVGHLGLHARAAQPHGRCSDLLAPPANATAASDRPPSRGSRGRIVTSRLALPHRDQPTCGAGERRPTPAAAGVPAAPPCRSESAHGHDHGHRPKRDKRRPAGLGVAQAQDGLPGHWSQAAWSSVTTRSTSTGVSGSYRTCRT